MLMRGATLVLALCLLATVGEGRSIKQRRLLRLESLQPLENARLDSSAGLLELPPNQEAQAYAVPPLLRQASSHATQELLDHVKFFSWDALFPGAGFSKVFNENGAFRRELRIAARQDFTGDATSALTQTMAADLRSSLAGRWIIERARKSEFPSTTIVLAKYLPEKSIDGESFFNGLFDLVPEAPSRFGSWMDIVGVIGRKVPHSWHQDSGRQQHTLMVGFPPSDGYSGIGVFSHAVKLTHRLADHERNEPRLWQQLKLLAPPEPHTIVRPLYVPGLQELMVYDDRDVFHSAPDFAHRESVWRIM